MKQAEIEAARITYIALLKAISEHHTLLIDEFKMKVKHDNKNLIRHIDGIISDLEKRLSPEHVEVLAGITDVYHNINLEIRQNVVNMGN